MGPFTGKNCINPIAAILSGAMMLQHSLGQPDAAITIENAVQQITPKLKGTGADKMGYTTTEVGDMIVEHVMNS